MNFKRFKKHTPFMVMAVLIVVSVMSAGGLTEQKKPLPKKHPKDWLTSVPRLESKVKNLQIINAKVINPGKDAAGVAFEVWNNSNRAVMAIEVSSGPGSIAKDGLEDEESPTIIIEPHGTLSAQMFDELNAGYPIVVTAGIFDDKKEEGQKSSLELMHKVRLRQRAILKARKEQSPRSRNQ